MATCRLFGVNRQEYYRAVKRDEQKRQVATEVVAMIEKVSMRMPRVGTRKLYHLLYNELKDMGVVRGSSVCHHQGRPSSYCP